MAALLIVGALVSAWLIQPQKNTVHRGRPISDWVREALVYENWQENNNARQIVITELRGKAVPLIIKHVRAECHSRLFYTLLHWQYRLPLGIHPLTEPEPRGKIAVASRLLSEMGEPARPAAAILGQSLKQSGMHIWEAQDVMTELIGMGPVAQGALPWLRRIAANSNDWQCVQAAVAIYTITGETNTLAQVIEQKLRAGQFSDERELFWFRGDEDLNDLLLPMVCGAAAERHRSAEERKQLLYFLAERETTNQLPRRIFETLVNTESADAVTTQAKKALEDLCSRATNSAGSKQE